MSLTVSVLDLISEASNPLLGIHPSWERVCLRDVATVLNGFAFPSKNFERAAGTPLIRIRDVGSASTECRYKGAFDKRYLVRAGDLIVGMDGDFRCARWQGTDALLNQRVCRVAVTSKQYLSEFLEIVLPAYLDAIRAATSSVTVAHLSSKSIAEIPLPLPPLAEQRRIVAKVEELLARVNAARERLSRAPAILKRFRQSVLAAACEGRLTEEWRKTPPSGETSAQLLGRIAGIRNARGSECGGLKQPASLDAMNVPETWEIASMDDLTLAITSGSRAWSKYYRADGPGTFIMAQNVRPLRFDRGYRLAVAPPVDDPEKTRTVVQRGDILVTIVGANTGDVCRVTKAVDQHYVCQSVAYMRPVLEGIAPFLELWLNSPGHGRRQYDDWIYGEGRPHLSLDHLRETAVALPPLAEQLEIARRVESLFNLTDAIETRVEAATARAEKLTQAILAKAFRGELVPTEAELARREGRDYEPAADLLERIARTRAL